MSEEKLIQFINTPQGEKKYDYDALGNKPQASNYRIYTEGNLPLPSKEYHGDIALVQTSSGVEKILPHICLKRRGKYVWFSFAQKPEDRVQIAKPFIQLYKDKLDKPVIILDAQKLNAPDIYIDAQKLNTPNIYIDALKLNTPNIYLVKKLDTPFIYTDDDFTPAILGEAILGSCRLGEA